MILITGATGNTGSFVVRKLACKIPAGSIVALVRPESNTRELVALGIQTHECDVSVPSTYLPVVEKGATFVGIANLRHSDKMLPHLVEAGIARAHCVTTTAVFSSYHSYSALYRQIEERLLDNDIPVSLLRPSMIYGNDRDHNMKKLIRVLNRTPVFPVFGDGTALMQPVHVEDLATGIATAIDRNATGPYDLAGPLPLTYNDILLEVASALDRKVRILHVNHRLAAAAVDKLQHLPKFPIKHEQVMRLQEDKAFDISRAVAELDYAPCSFADGIRQEVAQLINQPPARVHDA